nr:MAG TPA: hypothetical protein [Caudoviricetes sp.]
MSGRNGREKPGECICMGLFFPGGCRNRISPGYCSATLQERKKACYCRE